MSAYDVARSIITDHRPELLVDGKIDLERTRALRRVASTGGGVLLDVVLSLCGDGAVELHRLDALDQRNRDILAEAMRYI